MTGLDGWVWRAATPTVLKVSRVRLDVQGYSTEDRCYFGVGPPVFRIEAEETDDGGYLPPQYVRGATYQSVREMVREAYPDARILR